MIQAGSFRVSISLSQTRPGYERTVRLQYGGAGDRNFTVKLG